MPELADAFVRAYENALRNAGVSELAIAWESQTFRTKFLRDSILPNVAARLGLSPPEPELLRVDFALNERIQGEAVPRVFVESENIATDSGREIRKLCCLSAPLKVLISVCEWSDGWPGGGVRRQILDMWAPIVAAHRVAGTLTGELIALVSEHVGDQLQLHRIDLTSEHRPETRLTDIPFPRRMPAAISRLESNDR